MSFGVRASVFLVGAMALAIVAAPAAKLGIDRLHADAPGLADGLGIREVDGGYDFGRVFRRLAMLSALALAIVFRRRLGGVAIEGWRNTSRRIRVARFVGGLGFGAGSFAVFLGALATTGALTFAPDPWQRWPVAVLEAAAVGTVVAVIEELACRGWLQGGLVRGRAIAGAVVAASAVYATLHYFRSGLDVTYGFDPSVGVRAFAAHAAAMVRPEVLPSMFGLFLAGALLGYAYAWSRSLPFAVGVHAGWVAVLKSANVAVEERISIGWLWGEDGVIGTPIGLLFLVLSIAALRVWLGGRLHPSALAFRDYPPTV